jgi:hypothetical protein
MDNRRAHGGELPRSMVPRAGGHAYLQPLGGTRTADAFVNVVHSLRYASNVKSADPVWPKYWERRKQASSVNIVNRHHVGLKAPLVRVLRARRRSGKCRIVDFSSRKRATRICRDHTATSLRSGKSGVLALSLPSRALSGANSSGVSVSFSSNSAAPASSSDLRWSRTSVARV